jgi:hypothetical protein
MRCLVLGASVSVYHQHRRDTPDCEAPPLEHRSMHFASMLNYVSPMPFEQDWADAAAKNAA